MFSKVKKPVSVVLCLLLLAFCFFAPSASAASTNQSESGIQSIWQRFVAFFNRLFQTIKDLFRGTKPENPPEPPSEPKPPAEPEPLTAIKIISSDKVCELKTSENNPRNSEGDFAFLPDGRILFAYSKYRSGTGDDDDPCDIAGMISSDKGRTFTELPELLARASEHNTVNIMNVSLEVLKDGTVCLFYLVKNSDGSLESSYVMRKSELDTLSFGEPVDVIPNIPGDYYVVNNCRTQQLADGRIIVAAARHRIDNVNGAYQMRYVAEDVVYISDKNVTGFSRCSGFISLDHANSTTGMQEPGIQILPDGSYRLYARTDLGYQYESFSPDGINWTSPFPSSFESPVSPMLIERNPYSGLYYAIWNPYAYVPGSGTGSGRTRTPLVIAQSRDGIAFTDFTVLEDDSESGFCYPAIGFLSENEMLVSYLFGPANRLAETRIRRLRVE